MSNKTYTTAFAQSSNTTAIIDLSTRVQAALTASGSKQIIGPLQHETVLTAIKEQRCFILQDSNDHKDEILGCAMVKFITEDFFSPSQDFGLGNYVRPWKYVHSVMLEPGLQGKGTGKGFFEDVVGFLESGGGTVVLDCWAGNEKLREFYEKCGCRYIATVSEEDWEVAIFIKKL